MGYKMAVATSDGVNIDLHFGQTEVFTIYQVNEDGSYQVAEKRKVGEHGARGDSDESDVGATAGCGSGNGSGCGSGSGGGGGCGGGRKKNIIIETIEDCKAVLCAKCGAGTETELGKKRIASFVIEKRIDEALEKIISYYAHTNKKRS